MLELEVARRARAWLGASVDRENRFWVAEVAYAAIGVLAWFTLGGNIRLVTLGLLFLFAVRTALHEKRRGLEEKLDEKIDSERSRDESRAGRE